MARRQASSFPRNLWITLWKRYTQPPIHRSQPSKDGACAWLVNLRPARLHRKNIVFDIQGKSPKYVGLTPIRGQKKIGNNCAVNIDSTQLQQKCQIMEPSQRSLMHRADSIDRQTRKSPQARAFIRAIMGTLNSRFNSAAVLPPRPRGRRGHMPGYRGRQTPGRRAPFRHPSPAPATG